MMFLIYPVGEFTKTKDVDQLQSLIVPYLAIVSMKQYLGKDPATKSDEFLEKCQKGGGTF